MWIGFVVIVIIAPVLFFVIRGKKQKNINMSYTSDLGEFKAKGNLDAFTIKKDGRFEFLVKDGVIVACKDKERHQDYIYYGGEQQHV